jgi:hypothetical protein
VPHDHIVAVRQAFRPLGRDLLLDLGCQEEIEARRQIGFAFDFADRRAIFPRLRKAHATRDGLGVMLRHCRPELGPPFLKRRVAVLGTHGANQH